LRDRIDSADSGGLFASRSAPLSKVRVIAGVVCGVAVASCGEAIAPTANDLVVKLGVDSAEPPVISETPDGPQIVCTVRLAAEATGHGHASWQNGTAYWYTGSERVTPVDSTPIAANDLVTTFGGNHGIAAGETQHATWYFVSHAPFDLSLAFSYQVEGGSTIPARTRYRCGPDPATAVAPSVTRVMLSSSKSSLTPGDTVSVSYQEASGSGVWMTIIAAAGAFAARQVIGEGLATSVDRTVTFVVPSGVSAAAPLTITVQAYDAALNTRATSVVAKFDLAAQP
jgi:hypothetical protein